MEHSIVPLPQANPHVGHGHAALPNDPIARQRMQANLDREIEYMEKHKGHEEMHMEMAWILLLTMVVGQIALFAWKKWHPKSYQRCTLLGMWVVAPFIAMRSGFWRFIFSWSLYSIATSYMYFIASKNPLDRRTPRLVYKYFFYINKFTMSTALVGYVLVVLDIILGGQKWGDENIIAIGLVIMFYSLYYGVITRDLSELCADKMANTIGYLSDDGLPKKKLDPNVCSICTEDLPPVSTPEEELTEKICKLSCNHFFHEFCIRGWCIIGKKQTCPYCKEKVELQRMFKNPWEKQDLMYANVLDLLRYFVVWQPIIMMITNYVFKWQGLE